jgi:uncharacterized protein YraI
MPLFSRLAFPAILLAVVVSTTSTDQANATKSRTVATADLRVGPGLEHDRTAELPAGTKLINYGCVGGSKWCRIRSGGLRGWVAGSDLERQRPTGKYIYASYVRPAPEPSPEALGVAQSGNRGLLYDRPRHRFSKNKRWKHTEKFWKPKKFFKNSSRKSSGKRYRGGKRIKIKTSLTRSGFGLKIR